MKIAVVIPTYNEADNMRKMIPVLTELFKTMPQHDLHVIVVDGNSPDKTGEVVSNYAKSNNSVHLILEKEKRGIGSAYFTGFRYAMDQLHADAVVEMDADFQHDPSELPSIIEPLTQGYDYVIGSRFIKGGSIPKSWSFIRKFLSVGGSIFTKIVWGIYTIDDFTSGFKATRVKGYLDKLDLPLDKKVSFNYKVELLYKIYKMGAKVKQVPIKFGLRDRGDSKMESENFFNILFLVLRLRFFEHKEFLKFGIVGGLGFITDAGMFNILSWSDVVPRVSALISGIMAMTVTFMLNNRWSFRERKIVKTWDIIKNMSAYFAVSIIPIIFRSKLVALFDEWYGHNFWVYNTAFIIGVILGLIWNFLIYSKVIWRKRPTK